MWFWTPKHVTRVTRRPAKNNTPLSGRVQCHTWLAPGVILCWFNQQYSVLTLNGWPTGQLVDCTIQATIYPWYPIQTHTCIPTPTQQLMHTLTKDMHWLNPAKKETPHSFKGHQLENKLLYRLLIYIGLWVTFLALIWHQICNKRP